MTALGSSSTQSFRSRISTTVAAVGSGIGFIWVGLRYGWFTSSLPKESKPTVDNLSWTYQDRICSEPDESSSSYSNILPPTTACGEFCLGSDHENPILFSRWGFSSNAFIQIKGEDFPQNTTYDAQRSLYRQEFRLDNPQEVTRVRSLCVSMSYDADVVLKPAGIFTGVQEVSVQTVSQEKFPVKIAGFNTTKDPLPGINAVAKIVFSDGIDYPLDLLNGVLYPALYFGSLLLKEKLEPLKALAQQNPHLKFSFTFEATTYIFEDIEKFIQELLKLSLQVGVRSFNFDFDLPADAPEKPTDFSPFCKLAVQLRQTMIDARITTIVPAGGENSKLWGQLQKCVDGMFFRFDCDSFTALGISQTFQQFKQINHNDSVAVPIGVVIPACKNTTQENTRKLIEVAKKSDNFNGYMVDNLLGDQFHKFERSKGAFEAVTQSTLPDPVSPISPVVSSSNTKFGFFKQFKEVVKSVSGVAQQLMQMAFNAGREVVSHENFVPALMIALTANVTGNTLGNDLIGPREVLRLG